MLRKNLITASSLVHCNSSKVSDVCASLVKEEITYVSVGLIDGQSIFSAFSHPKWQELYVNCSLHHHDPSFNAAINIPSMPILWEMVPKNTKKAAIIMKERCEINEVISGLTISFKRGRKILLVTIGAKISESELLTKFNEDIISYLTIVRDVLC